MKEKQIQKKPRKMSREFMRKIVLFIKSMKRNIMKPKFECFFCFQIASNVYECINFWLMMIMMIMMKMCVRVCVCTYVRIIL